MKARSGNFALLALILLGGVIGVASPTRSDAAVPAKHLFRVESLPADLRPDFERLLLRMGDQEALFTLRDGQKPMSSGFWSGSFAADATAIPEIERMRTLLGAVTIEGLYYADVQVFARAWNGRRNAEAYVVHIPSLQGMIAREPGFWARLGVTPNSHPAAVVGAVEQADRADRHRGYGYLYGYPKYAVDFFVRAGDEMERTGRFVAREFVNIPTFESSRGQFVYAVPVGHRLNAQDGAIRDQAQATLLEYAVRRRRAVGEGKPGVVALWREWLTEAGVAR